jgi:hypothetical protein
MNAMDYKTMNKAELIKELEKLRAAVAKLRKPQAERKQAEERTKHLILVLKAIRNVNQLITQEKDRDKLLKGACKCLTETRGYYNAWIALLDESGKLAASAQSGLGKKFAFMKKLLKAGKLTRCGKKALK